MAFDTEESGSRVVIAAALAAALFSPTVRRTLRRGAVAALAGAMLARDSVAAFAGGVSRGIRQRTEELKPASESVEQ